ncbi:DegT/DnrJ/EryC1/StrS family aminotransferase [Planctomycetota bacterium]
MQNNNKKIRKIDLFKLNYDAAELEAVKDVLNSKWVSMGPKSQQLESEFSKYIGTKYGVALSNCTAALHLALRMLNIGEGDEVILPSLTFVATANAVLYVGARPVFADVTDVDRWTISPDDIEKKITSRTRAIIVMHYAGFGCEMDQIMDIAGKYNLKIIEDACHGPGGVWQNKRLGTFGDISCYSFYSNKNMSTAEGGMLLTDNAQYRDSAMLLRSHGMTTVAHERNSGAEFYDVVELGYNYRLDDIHSALGLVQLKKLTRDIETRNRSAKRYRENLCKIEGVSDVFKNYTGLSTYYIFPVLLTSANRSRVRAKLEELGIQTSIHYPPVHLFKHFSDYRVSLPCTEDICQRSLSLPIYANMADEDVDYVCHSLSSVLEQEAG